MDNSTEGVTVLGVFFLDVLNLYKDKPEIKKSLDKIVADLDLSDPMKMQPMSIYNELLDWLENNLGKANAKLAGKRIGQTVYQSLLDNKMIHEQSKPKDIMGALAAVARQVIKDPQNRGWEILDVKDSSLVMRRTQTFNSSVQFGVLEGLLFKCKGIYSPNVRLIKEVSKGDEFDDYELSWRN